MVSDRQIFGEVENLPEVLILVLMEDGLGLGNPVRFPRRSAVLILVLMEDGLGQYFPYFADILYVNM